MIRKISVSKILWINLLVAFLYITSFSQAHAQIPQAPDELEQLIQEWTKPWYSESWHRDTRVENRTDIMATEEQALRIAIEMLERIEPLDVKTLRKYSAGVIVYTLGGDSGWRVQLFSNEFSENKTIPHRYEIDVSFYFPMMVRFFLFDMDGFEIQRVVVIDEDNNLIDLDYETFLAQTPHWP